MTTSVLLGMPSRSARDSAGGVTISSLPTITRVGAVIRDNDNLASYLLSDAIAARATKAGVWITSRLAHSTRSRDALEPKEGVTISWLAIAIPRSSIAVGTFSTPTSSGP